MNGNRSTTMENQIRAMLSKARQITALVFVEKWQSWRNALVLPECTKNEKYLVMWGYKWWIWLPHCNLHFSTLSLVYPVNRAIQHSTIHFCVPSVRMLWLVLCGRRAHSWPALGAIWRTRDHLHMYSIPCWSGSQYRLHISIYRYAKPLQWETEHYITVRAQTHCVSFLRNMALVLRRQCENGVPQAYRLLKFMLTPIFFWACCSVMCSRVYHCHRHKKRRCIQFCTVIVKIYHPSRKHNKEMLIHKRLKN